MDSRNPFLSAVHVDPGNGLSEDLVGSSETAVWVLDGASGLTERSYTPGPTDGRWFVEQISAQFEQRMDDDRELESILEQCIADVASNFDKVTGDQEINEEDKPSAALAVVRIRENNIESVTLGDCSIVHRIKTGDIRTQFGEGPRHLDQKVIERMTPILRDADATYRDAWEAVENMLIEHRRLKNTPEGYWTLGLNPDAVSHADIRVLEPTDLGTSYMFTDGFEPIVGRYDLFSDWDAATTYLDENGGKRAFRILRAIEASDEDCSEYPRLKPHDDAALAVLDWS